jgi:hypothetical protein
MSRGFYNKPPTVEDALTAHPLDIKDYLREVTLPKWQVEQVARCTRPYYWLPDGGWDGFDAYMECTELWGAMIDENGKFTDRGFRIANRIPEDGKPSLEEYIASKYELSQDSAFDVASCAMWDVLGFRGLPINEQA